jgi:3-oxoacyl-[acyl-carrier protein] reductase
MATGHGSGAPVSGQVRPIGAVAVVTGGARGIGYAAAAGLAELGARVCIVDRDRDRAEQAMARLRTVHGAVGLVVCGDVADPSLAASVREQVEATLGPVDVLVNAAAILSSRSFDELDLEEWRRVLAVNTSGVYYLCRALLPRMLERRRGRIVNVSSLAAKQGGGGIGTSAYATAKAAVLGLTKALASLAAPHGVTVNCVAPGSIETEMTAPAYREDPSLLPRTVVRIPMGRRGRAVEVADVIVFLASDSASYICGEAINVDGGSRME